MITLFIQSLFFCLQQDRSKATFGENVIMENTVFTENGSIVPKQFQFIHADFLIPVFAGTNQIFIALHRCPDNVNLNLFPGFCVCSPPLPDITEHNGQILCITQQILLMNISD